MDSVVDSVMDVVVLKSRADVDSVVDSVVDVVVLKSRWEEGLGY